MTMNPATRALRPDAAAMADMVESIKDSVGKIAPYEEPTEEQLEAIQIQRQLAALQGLREAFPPHMIEKLPKPKWSGAWDGQKGGTCPECHGYHVLANAIHLDYVGHANVTNRLLEVDPFWSWEPMALTADGTPLFTDGGLWIRLTVCGVTRLGFGDATGKGSKVKEIIGDAIRNAAMRFGVGLDLWAKIDLHAERNPGDGETPRRNGDRVDGQDAPRTGGGRASGRRDDHQVDQQQGSQAPPVNQEALDTLGGVCDENGIPRNEVRGMYHDWVLKHPEVPRVDLLRAKSDDITAFTTSLILAATGEGDAGEPGDEPEAESADPGEEGAGAESGSSDGGATDTVAGNGPADVPADDGGGSVGEVAPDDGTPVDPKDLF